MEEPVVIGGVYRHFKGNMYLVKDIAEHSETGDKLVIYQALYDGNKVYARPVGMFSSEVDRGKYPEVIQDMRFELIASPNVRAQWVDVD